LSNTKTKQEVIEIFMRALETKNNPKKCYWFKLLRLWEILLK